MKKKTIEVFHLFGNSSLSRMSDNLVYKIMDNISFKKIEKSILSEIDEYEKLITRSPEHSELFSKAIEKNKKLLTELIDHFDWIVK